METFDESVTLARQKMLDHLPPGLNISCPYKTKNPQLSDQIVTITSVQGKYGTGLRIKAELIGA
jgi:hypothetical protein